MIPNLEFVMVPGVVVFMVIIVPALLIVPDHPGLVFVKVGMFELPERDKYIFSPSGQTDGLETHTSQQQFAIGMNEMVGHPQLFILIKYCL